MISSSFQKNANRWSVAHGCPGCTLKLNMRIGYAKKDNILHVIREFKTALENLEDLLNSIDELTDIEPSQAASYLNGLLNEEKKAAWLKKRRIARLQAVVDQR